MCMWIQLICIYELLFIKAQIQFNVVYVKLCFTLWMIEMKSLIQRSSWPDADRVYIGCRICELSPSIPCCPYFTFDLHSSPVKQVSLLPLSYREFKLLSLGLTASQWKSKSSNSRAHSHNSCSVLTLAPLPERGLNLNAYLIKAKCLVI